MGEPVQRMGDASGRQAAEPCGVIQDVAGEHEQR
jgi:hypothetical protein